MPLPTFFDDFIVPIVAECPVTLLRRLKKALSLTASALAKSGMQINDKPGNTEILINFHGSGKQHDDSMRKCAHITTIHVSGPTFKSLDVQIVDQYRHLGSYNAGCQQHAYEAAMRAAQCNADFAALSKGFYRQQAIPQARRLLVLHI